MKIRLKVIFAFLLVTGMFGMVGWEIIATVEEVTEASIGESSVVIAKEAMYQIDKGLNQHLESFLRYNRHGHIRDLLVASNAEFLLMQDAKEEILKRDAEWRGSEEGTELMDSLIQNNVSRSLRNLMKSAENDAGYRVFGEIFLTNLYGVNVAQTGRTSDYLQSDEEWWQLAQRNSLSVSDVEFDESSHIYSIALGLRVDDSQENFLGVMKVVLNIEEVIGIINDLKLNMQHPSTQIILLNADREILYSTEPHRIFEKFPHSDHTTEEEGYFLIEEKGKLYSYALERGFKRFHQNGWTLVVENNKEDILAPLLVLKQRLLFLYFLGIAATLVIGLFVSNQLIRPIEQLTNVIEQISKGKLDVTVEQRLKAAKDEVGKLARSFDRTIVSLKLAMRKK